jgi:integrase
MGEIGGTKEKLRESGGNFMSLFRRNKIWYTDFTVNGQRYKQSLDTTDWREAKGKEKALIGQAEQGRLAPSSQQFARLRFEEALERYLMDRQARVASRSHRTEADHAKPLRTFFGTAAVRGITVDGILSYLRARKVKGISNTTLNMELGILRRVLKRAKRWHLLADDCKPLPERRDIGRALTNDEKLRLLKLAGTRPEWQLARLAAVLALNTTMRGCEIRGLRWRDVDFLERTLTIRRSETKTDAGHRLIPLNAGAWGAILELRERAKLLFGSAPKSDWYVFPHGEGQGPSTEPKNRPGPKVTVKPDPTQPMSTWRTAWRSLTRAVQCPTCGQLQQPGEICGNEKCKADIHDLKSSLHGLRFHDLRHHAITELAESVASDQTIMSIAGHVSPRMLAHYSHVRLDAKRKALDALSSGALKAVTSHGTSQDSGVPPEVLEKNGGDDGTRTRDLCRDRAAF